MNSTKLVVALTALNVAVCAFTLARTATVCAKPETPKETAQAATAEPPQHAAVCDCGFREFRAMATNAVLKLEASIAAKEEDAKRKGLLLLGNRDKHRRQKASNEVMLNIGYLLLNLKE